MLLTEHIPRRPDDSLIYPLGAKEKLEREIICRQCGLTWTMRRRRTRHHLVPQSWFLGFDPDHAMRALVHARSNLVPLCRDCHDKVDSRHPVVRGWARARLRLVLTQQEVAFVIAVAGRSWLEREYPLDSLGTVV